MKANKFFVLIIFLAISNKMIANVAQPGLWNAGGMGNFSLLYPDDSLAYKKIQMVDEKISIQLYKGYAVIKGVYKMYNDTKDTITLKTGYPLNSNFKSESDSRYRADIQFDSLYGLDVIINSIPVKIISEPSESRNGNSGNENWYVWQNSFTPEDTTVITVYFIVSTNNNFVRNGYSKSKFNGFIYILESGSTWKQPIISGEIRIKLEDGINTNEIKGLKPDSVFRISENKNILQYKFTNLSPMNTDNVIITYSENIERFSLPEILKNKSSLYKIIDGFSEMEINSSELTGKKFQDPNNAESDDTGFLLLILSLIGIPLFIFSVIVILIIVFLIWIRKRKNKHKLN